MIKFLPFLLLSLGVMFSLNNNINAQTQISLTCADANFSDSGGSGGNYSDFENYQYTICPDVPGDKVTLTFTLIDIEWAFDTLHIYDGLVVDYSSTRRTPPWGLQDASAVFTSTSSDGCLTAIFGSDASHTQSGWSAVISCSTPMPVELISFTADEQTRSVNLKWTTASEENNKGFDIEHSTDGHDWEVLDFVGGRGTTAEMQQYTFTDEQPKNGYNYYRLKQVDHDGQFEYSDVRTIQLALSNHEQVSVFPNPSKGQFRISLQNLDGRQANAKLMDSTGRLIWHEGFEALEMPTNWEKSFDLPQREVYFLVMQIGEEIFTEKIYVIGDK